MNIYAIKVSFKNSGSSVHDPSCSVVVNKCGKEGVHMVEGASADAVRTQWDEDNGIQARGLPLTRVCKCANAGE